LQKKHLLILSIPKDQDPTFLILTRILEDGVSWLVKFMGCLGLGYTAERLD
jgi:hypothetical protein